MINRFIVIPALYVAAALWVLFWTHVLPFREAWYALVDEYRWFYKHMRHNILDVAGYYERYGYHS